MDARIPGSSLRRSRNRIDRSGLGRYGNGRSCRNVYVVSCCSRFQSRDLAGVAALIGPGCLLERLCTSACVEFIVLVSEVDSATVLAQYGDLQFGQVRCY